MRATTGMSSPLKVTVASGLASRVAVHAGWCSLPKLLPTTRKSSPTGRVASGVLRGSPLFRPVVVSTMLGTIDWLRATRPPVSLLTKRSMGGNTLEPVAANARVVATFCTALLIALSERAIRRTVTPRPTLPSGVPRPEPRAAGPAGRTSRLLRRPRPGEQALRRRRRGDGRELEGHHPPDGKGRLARHRLAA